MNRHHFISYSSADAQDFALRLCDELAQGPPPIPVWLDKRELVAGSDWDDQIVEAIRDCASVIFVMTRDSVTSKSVCKKEWTRALKYKKPIIPILLHPDAEMPFSLEPRQHIDFTGAFDPALARLRNDLQHLSSPAGLLQQMKDRLADAQRDLPRAADEAKKSRIQDDIAQIERQIADQQKIVDDPEGAARRVQESIERGLERERKPERPVTAGALSKFINPPPGVAPSYFQDRHVETKLVGNFLNDESLRMMTVVGRGGVGKTAMVCRLLKSLEHGRLPDDLGPMSVDGIVYLSATGSRRVTFPNIFADLCKLLPDEVAQRLDALYKNPQVPTEAKMRTLLEAFPAGRTVLLLDNFEDLVYPETLKLRDPELDEALSALLNAPHHAVKAIITTRLTPRDLLLTQPSRQRRRDIDEGLESPYAENILREMDADGKLGLKTASDAILNEARERTRGYPRALEALFAILSADRDTSLQEVLNDAQKLLPEHVVEALVGEAFSRLDPAARQVMQALAIYGRPVTPAAIDYLLQPHLPGVNSAPILSRMVNMLFARKEAGHYYLHPVDRAYALSRAPVGDKSDRENYEAPPYTQFALRHRGAEYFKEARTPRENWNTIEDLAPQLAEFDLRCEGQDYDTAMIALLESVYHLSLWGYYLLCAKLLERLQGNLNNPHLQRISLNDLGRSYISVGKYQEAVSCCEKALAIARELSDKSGESEALSGLGWCHSEQGDLAQAVDSTVLSLALAREVDDQFLEGASLSNLSWYYSKQGKSGRAIEYCEQALEVFRETGERYAEGVALSNLAGVLTDEGRYTEAVKRARESIEIGVELNSPMLGNWSNCFLAIAHLYDGDLEAARAASEYARQHDEPENNPNVLAALGVIALRQGNRAAAQEAFAVALDQTETMLKHNRRNQNSLDMKGLALCGSTLCDGVNRTSAAIEAYKSARAINKDVGIVARVLRLFDALAVVDSAGALKDVRAAAAGE
jgi:tetratricopeptide (TPR) repeat protein